jgi:N-acetylneuraminate synthase
LNKILDIKKGDVFYETDISGIDIKPRAYKFNRPWGIPVRYHDIKHLTKNTPVNFVEMHFSYRDLDINPVEFLSKSQDLDLIVHSPELFSGDHIMDLASNDDKYRKHSIFELQRVIDKTRDLRAFFRESDRTKIVINAGGFSSDQFIAKKDRKDLYSKIKDSISELDLTNVEIIPQTMPPFPWHFGGQRYHNLFLEAEEIVEFCDSTGMRVCLDISHSKLASNYFGWAFDNFISKIGSYVAHLHIVDAKGSHDEGLQIGAGEINFRELMKNLDKYCPNVSFIPEIWQGHKNDGEGFWVALDMLERSALN